VGLVRRRPDAGARHGGSDAALRDAAAV
jgi:hypothetical protein